MNQYLKSLIEHDNLFGGKLTRDGDFAKFERLSLEELERLDESEIAYATQSMGRAVFQLSDDNKIINIKGVDSHLQNKEIGMTDLVGAKSMYIVNDNKSYQDSTYPINLVIFPGNKTDIRIRGASPLEDLEIEADINEKMRKMGIKLPQIKNINEFTNETALKLGLPIKIPGSYTEFDSDYTEENDERKQNLHRIYGNNYKEDVPKGLRAEKISEYFKRIGVLDSTEFQNFAKENGFWVEDFVNYVDKTYAIGQRYGQAERQMDSPFRISDLEYYIKTNDKKAVEDIANFTMQTSSSKNFESDFAIQMGTNIAKLMNNGWVCENFVHRQDYTLAGEMCDDSYYDFVDHIEKIKQQNINHPGKSKAIERDCTKAFYTQVFLISSNIKVLQDEMKMRGKSQEEIESVLTQFISAFGKNINFSDVSKKIGINEQEVKDNFSKVLNGENNYSKLMASKNKPEGIVYDEEILLAHNENEIFYNEVASLLTKELHLDKIQSTNIAKKFAKEKNVVLKKEETKKVFSELEKNQEIVQENTNLLE